MWWGYRLIEQNCIPAHGQLFFRYRWRVTLRRVRVAQVRLARDSCFPLRKRCWDGTPESMILAPFLKNHSKG